MFACAFVAASGGAEVLAKSLVRVLGPKRVHLCLMVVALAVAMTTWFAVGLVMLVPILLSLARQTGEPFLKLAIPLLAVLSIMHGVMPPHPGPLVALDALKANLGGVILWGFVAAIPVAAVSGPIFARWAVGRVEAVAPAAGPLLSDEPGAVLPSLGRTVAALAFPVVLILSQTVAELAFAPEHPVRAVISLVGNPTVALCLSVLFALWAFRITPARGLGIAEKSLGPVGMTLLLVGGGGGFNRLLRESGAADAIGALAQSAHLPTMLFGWVCAALIRVATGSATVAITAASGLVAPLVALDPTVNRELLVVGIGCGSMSLSHLNDSGFWIVKETLGLSVPQTLKTWTVTETLIGITGLFVAWGLDTIF